MPPKSKSKSKSNEVVTFNLVLAQKTYSTGTQWISCNDITPGSDIRNVRDPG